MPPFSVEWLPQDSTAPIAQGDLVLVAWAKTVSPSEAQPSSLTHPPILQRDQFDLRFWEANANQIKEMWGRMNYGIAVVIPHDCAIDKEFNVLLSGYEKEGVDTQQAATLAHQKASPFVAVAEAWPLTDFPAHLRDLAERGNLGYIPFLVGQEVTGKEHPQTWVVDLNHITTISQNAVVRRLGIGGGAWKLHLQSCLCQFFAARNIRIAEELSEIFQQPIYRVEALTTINTNKTGRQKLRVRFHFENGQHVDVEANYEPKSPEPVSEVKRPGLNPDAQEP